MPRRSRAGICPTGPYTLPLLLALLGVVTACGEAAGPATGTPFAFDEPALAALGLVGRPLTHLTGEQRRLVARGKVVFQTVFTPETGLGPLFNSTACAGCHEVPVPGGAGGNEEEEASEDVEVHATAYQGGVCNNLSDKGGQVIQQRVTPALHDALGIDREPVPAEATGTGHRTTPALFGFGLLDAVPDEQILALADPDDRDGDGISGRPNRSADGRLGRFGRKALVPTLREFNGDAFVMEMGITTPTRPREEGIGGNPLPAGVDPTPDPEITQEDVDAADAFVRFLAPPPQGLSFAPVPGRGIFSSIGCAACHVPALRTGDNAVAALRNRVVPAYTDLLLHDVGPDLADICLGLADPSEFRTEPLMGVRFKSAFLHDGRAPTIEAAIELHGGEAAAARDRFVALSKKERTALLRFLKRL